MYYKPVETSGWKMEMSNSLFFPEVVGAATTRQWFEHGYPSVWALFVLTANFITGGWTVEVEKRKRGCIYMRHGVRGL